jgi:hypothetical protein
MTYDYRINVRIGEEDWATLMAIDKGQPNARPVDLTHKPNTSVALRVLFEHYRITARVPE